MWRCVKCGDVELWRCEDVDVEMCRYGNGI